MHYLLLAIVLNNQLKGHSFFRTAYFMPNVLDMIVVEVIWVYLCVPRYGVILQLLNIFCLEIANVSGYVLGGCPGTN